MDCQAIIHINHSQWHGDRQTNTFSNTIYPSKHLISPQMYKEMVSPYHKQLFDFIRKTAKVPVHIFYHSCGAAKELIPYLIDEGVDILNPVQVSAVGMDSKELKREFGEDITFWGGAVDTQIVLPTGTVQQVKDEVKRRIDDLAPGGGFVFNPVHNVQSDVPAENYYAMWEALQEFGVYWLDTDKPYRQIE